MDATRVESPAPAAGQDLSCAMTAVLLRRVRGVLGEDGVTQLLARAGSRRTPEHLSDLGSWIAFEEALALWEAGAELCDDPLLPRRVGADVVERLAGSGTSSALRGLGSPERLLASIDVVSRRFSAVSELTAAEVRPGHAEVRMTAAPGHRAHRAHCAWTAGLLSQSSALFGLAPAGVERPACQVDGADACAFVVKWDPAGAAPEDAEARADRLAAQVEAMSERLQTVFDTAADLIGHGDLDSTLERICGRAAQQVRAPAYLLAVRDGDGTLHRHATGFAATWADAAAEQVLAGDRASLPDHWLAVDVRSDLRDYGTLAACQHPGGRFLAPERALLEVYARYAAVALDTATALAEARRQQHEAQRRYEDSRTLLQLARRMAGAASSEQVAGRLADAIPEVIDCDRVSVYLWSEAAGELRRAAKSSVGPEADAPTGVAVFRPEERPGLAEWLQDPDPQPAFVDFAEPGVRKAFNDLDACEAVVVPIATPQRFLGCFIASTLSGAGRLQGSPELLDRVASVATHVVTALENGRLVDQITHQATHDQLTGVANRAGFGERMMAAGRAAAAGGSPFVLFFLDLDGFKAINDRHGHEVGDDLLRAVGLRLGACLRDTDTLARLGGDEFAVLADGSGGREGLEALAARLVGVFHDPFVLGGLELHVGASVGRADWAVDGTVAEDLLRAADAAMYAEKRSRALSRDVPPVRT